MIALWFNQSIAFVCGPEDSYCHPRLEVTTNLFLLQVQRMRNRSRMLVWIHLRRRRDLRFVALANDVGRASGLGFEF